MKMPDAQEQLADYSALSECSGNRITLSIF